MRLIVGLGNPGEEYAHTRHNIGFDVVDLLAEELPSSVYWKSECGALCAHVRIEGVEAILMKPLSFMNASGGPVASMVRKHRIALDEIIVIHDDLDLPVGTIRVKPGGGLGGHNGLKSIEAKLGTREWVRVKVGIGRPLGRKSVVDHVLEKPRKDEAEPIAATIAEAAEAVRYLLVHTVGETQNRFN